MLDTVRLGEALADLVATENLRLDLRRAEGRRELEARFGPRPVRVLTGASSLRLTRLSLALPCYAPQPPPGREDQAPERVRLDRPGFWRRLFRRWRPLVLLFEIEDDGSEALARASLRRPDELGPAPGSPPAGVKQAFPLPDAPEEQE